MKEITLANNKGIAIIDDEDFEEIRRCKWHLFNAHNGCCYALTNIKSEKTKGGRTTISMQRMILKPMKKEQIDHLNHGGLDNQKTNLRICNNSQNQMNKRKSKNQTSSQYKGVGWHVWRKKWQAFIGQDSCQICIGYFDNEELAALAYNKKAVELFGDFAYLNMVVG